VFDGASAGGPAGRRSPAYLDPGRRDPGRLDRGGHDPTRWLIATAVVVAVALALVPLVFLAWESVHTPAGAAGARAFSLRNFRDAAASPATLALLRNSLLFAAGTAGFALVVGTLLAWLNERTDVPLRRVFFAVALVPLIVPGILFAAAWMLLASPRIGLLNVALQRLTGTGTVFVDVYSLRGMIFVDGLHYSPLAFLLMSTAFRAMDPSLEEAATMSGASPGRVAWHVTLKLARPAMLATLLIVFVRALESFEVPALLGLPAGIAVFTSAIYEAVHQYPSRIGLASTYALVLLAITLAGVRLHARLVDRRGRYATVTGKGYRPRPVSLGRWRWPCATLLLAYLLLVAVLPFAVLLWSSLQPWYRLPGPDSLATLTLAPYRNLFGYPALPRSLANSLLLAIGTATAVTLLGAVIAWTVVRSRKPGRALLDAAASLPIAVPGLVLGLAMMLVFIHLPIGIYGTLWILLLAYITRFLPYGVRYGSVSMLQIHHELEESALMSGATWTSTLRHVVLPLLKPGLVAGWIYVVIVSMRELSSSLLLYSPGSEVISVVIWELWENGQHAELSALGVLFILLLLALVSVAQLLGRRFGVREA
jgi:iron(III) transport system permease protein